ncbi:hypothetical protein O6H91_11G085500 [Diphasiastrum complanatum]|uniref:Uncharacterized protein n=2 Tax=Diphasiastrum complanatum TaxID=34168 RepID=A0ACC2CB68_DIPCM|nr:hypothetical protein O6H91_11G071300 [Diphasiastrum complanatum]KAJ7539294.1 hypothetical protein O6H91_11G085500 [Diphasiastrum complanatum]
MAHAVSFSACIHQKQAVSYSAQPTSKSHKGGCERIILCSGKHFVGGRSVLVWREPYNKHRQHSLSHAVCHAMHVEEGAFFDSTQMQAEIGRIQKEFKELLHLGENFCQFDREGKLSYISAMKDVLERWKVFHKRMELSDDFIAKLCAKQLKTKTGPQEESYFDALSFFYDALDDFKRDADMST